MIVWDIFGTCIHVPEFAYHFEHVFYWYGRVFWTLQQNYVREHLATWGDFETYGTTRRLR